METAVFLQAPADVGHQFVLEGAAVQTLQNHFAQLQQEHLIVLYHESFLRIKNFYKILYLIFLRRKSIKYHMGCEID